MSKELLFKKNPTLEDLAGLEVNGGKFAYRRGNLGNGIVMHIPGTFRFKTDLEVVYTTDGTPYLVMSQLLTGGPKLWEMEEAFGRIGFRDPEIETQLRAMCDELVNRGLAEWVEG